MATPALDKLFVRKSSGLIREIGVFGAMVFGVHCISLSSSGLIPFSWVASVWPGASIIGVLTLAMALGLVHAYTYAAIGSSMPRAGADYVFASRVLSPPLAFAASWTLVIFSGVVAGALVAWIPSSVLPTLLKTMAIVFNNPGYDAAAAWSASTTGILAIGTLGVIVTLLSMLLPTRTIVRTLAIGFWLGLLAWLIIYYSLATASGPEAFQAAWDKFMGAGSYASRIPAAEAAGMQYSTSVSTMTLAGLIMGFWIYYGYYIPTFFAGEVKQASRTLLIGSWSSLIITWAVFALGSLLLQRLVPLKWIAAEGYLANNTDTFAMPWITFYAAILKPSLLLVLIVTVAWLYTLINLAQTYFFYVSRIVFAWAFDRVVPDRVASVHPRLHSPVVAVVLATLLAEYGVIDAATGGVLGAQLNFVFFAVVTQLVAVTAFTLFPYLKPEIFEAAPDWVKRRIGGIPVTTIIGVATLAYLLWMIIASFAFPAVSGGIGSGTLLTLAAFLGSGLAVYYTARWYRMKHEGIDIAWTFKSIPPV